MAALPTYRIAKTLLGVSRELSALTGIPSIIDRGTTLNTKYGVIPDVVPTTSLPVIKYFGIGINGRHTVTDTNLTEPNEVRMVNMDLYTPIPFRCVPIEEDLSASERVNYRLRVVSTIRGQSYVSYYLKLLSFSDDHVRMTRTNATTGVAEDYTIDYANLSPTPPQSLINGTVTDTSQELNVSVMSTVDVSGSEVVEAVNVLYDGDLRYAMISEIGIYSGFDQVTAARDFSGAVFNYTDSAYTQLNVHYTYNGDDLSNPTAKLTKSFEFAKGDVILL